MTKSKTDSVESQLFFIYKQGWGAGTACFWPLGAGAHEKKNQEPAPAPQNKAAPKR